MKEILHVAFSPSHFLFSTLLLMSLLYWVIVFMGIFNIDSFDFGKDIDVDADIDTDVSVDKSVQVGKEVAVGNQIGWFTNVLIFFNFGRVPFMVIISIMSLIAWTISMLKTYYLGLFSLPVEFAWHIPVLLFSLIITKYITNPLRGLFKDFETEFKDNKQLVGKVCEINTTIAGTSVGQARIKSRAAPVLIMIQSIEGLTMEKGSQALVVDYDPEKKIYFVEPFIGIE